MAVSTRKRPGIEVAMRDLAMPEPDAAELARAVAASEIGTVERNSLSGQAYQRIRKALMIGALKPGEKLSGRDLAARLGTSLTPVREALLQLVAEGVLESRTGHSIVVPTLTRADFLELRDIRVHVEGLSAARAAAQADEALIAGLETLHASLVQAKAEQRYDDALRWNEAFHLALARGSGMPRLVRVVESLWAQSGPFLNFLYRPDDAPLAPGAVHNHVRVLDALRARDPEAAARAIADDITEGGNDLVSRLAR
ncbi:GntR family transcriptional regulator [Methylobacterium tarhaniae]